MNTLIYASSNVFFANWVVHIEEASMFDALGLVAGLLLCAAFVPYIWRTLIGKAKPQMVSWGVWGLTDAIILYGMVLSNKDNWHIWFATGAAITMFLLSIIFGEQKFDKPAKVGLIGSVVSLCIWWLSGNAISGIGIACFTVVISGWPTYMSAKETPQNESLLVWSLMLASASLTFGIELGQKGWGWSLIQPLAFAAVPLAVVYALAKAPKRSQ